MPDFHKPIKIGYAIEPGKRERFFNAFMDATKGRAEFVKLLTEDAAALDLKQANVDVIIHKLKKYDPDGVASQLSAFRTSMIDPVPSVAVLEDRAATSASLEAALAANSVDCTLSTMKNATGADSQFEVRHAASVCEIAVPPFAIVAPYMSGAEQDVIDVFAIHEIEFPVVLKPRASRAHREIYKVDTVAQLLEVLNIIGDKRDMTGSMSSSKLISSMASWLSVPRGADTSETQYFVQKYVPHQGVMWKVCVIGDNVIAQLRQSIPLSSSGVVAQVSKSAASSPVGDLPAGLHNTLLSAANTIKACMRLSLFNFDVVIQDGSEPKYFIVDVNYFPSFAGIPRMHDVLLDHLRNEASSSSKAEKNKELATHTFPQMAGWVEQPVDEHNIYLQTRDLQPDPAVEADASHDQQTPIQKVTANATHIIKCHAAMLQRKWKPAEPEEMVKDQHYSTGRCVLSRNAQIAAVSGLLIGIVVSVSALFFMRSRLHSATTTR